MKGATVVIVGAGFSKPAGGPLMAELLDDEYCHDARASRLGLINGLKVDMARRSIGRASYTFEDYFSDIYREARTGGVMRFADAEFGADQWLGEIITHLSSVTSHIRLARRSRAYQSYSNFLKQLPTKSTTFISFNYDLLLEQLLNDQDISFTYGLPRPVQGTTVPNIGENARQMRLLKLHGSVNWLICRGCDAAGSRRERVSVLDRPYVPLVRKKCPSCRQRYGELALVPPIYGKSGEAGYLVDVWKKARAELREATRLIIIGYSLPASDLEARSLLRELSQDRGIPTLLVAGPAAAANYQDVVPNLIDSRLFAEEFFEHMRYAATKGSDEYRRRFSNAIPGFGRFYTPQLSS